MRSTVRRDCVEERHLICGVTLGVAVREIRDEEAAARASGRRALDIGAIFNMRGLE